jgi:hypothetical protein
LVPENNAQSPLNNRHRKWTDFAAEVQKRSSKLASFVRNAVPQSLSGTQLKLAFKSGTILQCSQNKTAAFWKKLRQAGVARGSCQACEISPIVTSRRTIVEHDQIILEQARELKRKNAMGISAG